MLPALFALAAQTVSAQDRGGHFDLKLDSFFRDEWTRSILQSPDEERWRFQLRPRLELRAGGLTLGVGGEYNHSSEDNVKPRPALVRDNYDAKDLRLDLAFARVEAGSWLRLNAGRFLMPIGLTEMLWDRDLRPQGAALTLRGANSAGAERVALTVLAARGSHVFDDESTEMLLVSGGLSWPGDDGGFQLLASFLTFHDQAKLEPMIRRQNTRLELGGPLAHDYRVLDLVARWHKDAGVPTQLVVDLSWNTAVDEGRRGLWVAGVLGSTRTARARFEYTFARVETDATVAAYATDDFFWSTGWKGHRADLGVRLTDTVALHLTGQLQQFADSPRLEERDHWVKRVRADVRVNVD